MVVALTAAVASDLGVVTTVDSDVEVVVDSSAEEALDPHVIVGVDSDATRRDYPGNDPSPSIIVSHELATDTSYALEVHDVAAIGALLLTSSSCHLSRRLRAVRAESVEPAGRDGEDVSQGYSVIWPNLSLLSASEICKSRNRRDGPTRIITPPLTQASRPSMAVNRTGQARLHVVFYCWRRSAYDSSATPVTCDNLAAGDFLCQEKPWLHSSSYTELCGFESSREEALKPELRSWKSLRWAMLGEYDISKATY